MKHVQLIVSGEERRITHMNYEYFRPGISNREFYNAFLKKHFPYNLEDGERSYLYKDYIPEYTVTTLDKELANKAKSNTFPFSFNQDNRSEQYYNRLTELRYLAGLDRGMIPNIHDLYDMAPWPSEMPYYRPALTSTVGGYSAVFQEQKHFADAPYQDKAVLYEA